MAATKRRPKVMGKSEREEFIRLGNQLRQNGATDKELMAALNVETTNQLNSILSGGNTTPDRLERLKAFADEIFPKLLTRKAQKKQEDIAAKAERVVTAMEAAPPTYKKETKEEVISDDPEDHPARGSITPAQHKQLREWINHLIQVYGHYYGTLDDPHWSRLAPTLGLKNGKSAKRAYEVGCSPRSYFHLKRSINMHAAYGSTAAEALAQGVPIEKLLAKNGNGTRPAGREPTPAAPPIEPTAIVEEEAPTVTKASALLEFLEAGYAYVERLYKAREFFDLMAAANAVPKQLRRSAEETRDYIDAGIEEFSPGFLETRQSKLPG